MKRSLAITMMVMLIAVGAAASGTSFEVMTPRNAVEGTRFSLTFSLQNAQGNASTPAAPQLDGCTLLYGPATSTMSSYQVVNGRASSSTSTDYTFTYRADKAGDVTIPPVTITVDNKKYSSRQVSFSILPPDKQAQSAQQGQSMTPQGGGHQGDFKVAKDDVLIRVILGRTHVYEQEAIECTIKLYTKYNISSFLPKTQPSFDGFLIEDLNVQAYLGEREHYNGSNYYTAVLKRCLLYPQRSGNLTINSGQYDLTVLRQRVINDWPFARTIEEEEQITVNSNSASIDVTPLPQPQPAGFNGAVGRFNIDSRLVGNSFRTNEAATLIYTITGTGNIKYLKEPDIDFPSEFELYTPRTENNARVSGNNMTGSMTVEYTFVPQSVGEFNIGTDTFVYFDPSKKEYVTLHTQPYSIKVQQGATVSTAANNTKQDITAKNTDILHIKLGDKQPRQSHTYAIQSSWYWILIIIATLGLVLAIALNARAIKASADVQGRKTARAGKEAKKRLKAAGNALRKNAYDEFYAELLKALMGYLGDKLGLPASQMSRDNVDAALAERGVSTDILASLHGVIDECEMARYTPQSSSEKAEAVYNNATGIINQMESVKIKKTK